MIENRESRMQVPECVLQLRRGQGALDVGFWRPDETGRVGHHSNIRFAAGRFGSSS